jgi:hypothetical protein
MYFPLLLLYKRTSSWAARLRDPKLSAPQAS